MKKKTGLNVIMSILLCSSNVLFAQTVWDDSDFTTPKGHT